MPPILHPHIPEMSEPMEIVHPSEPTPLGAWSEAGQMATVVPGGPMPAALNGVAFAPTAETGPGPISVEGIAEPPFEAKGLKPAAGVVILEADGRLWAVSPTNQFGGYTTTFPKGRPEPGHSLQVAAVREAFEESGLRVELLAHLMDATRATTRTRYYLARRVGGTPSAMGWESQAVHLVPPHLWTKVLAHPNDQPVLAALKARLGANR